MYVDSLAATSFFSIGAFFLARSALARPTKGIKDRGLVPPLSVTPDDPIHSFLAAVRRGLRRQQAWAGAAVWVSGAGTAGLALLLAAAMLGPSTAWRPLALFGVLAALGSAVLAGQRAFDAWRSDDAVARFVEGRLPELRDDLRSAVELGTELPRLVERPVLSTVLVEELRRGVQGRLSGVAPERLLRPQGQRHRRRSAIALAAFGGLWLLALVASPGALRRGLAELRVGRARVVATSVEPIVGDLSLELRMPAYTRLPPRVIPSSSGQVLALPGTEVRIEARLLVPRATTAALGIEADGQPAGTELPVELRGHQLSARFTVDKPGSYRFIIGAGGHRVREPEGHRIDLDADRAPRVDLYAPAEVLEVAGPRRVELAWSVDDDYGLGPLDLVWRVAGGAEQRRTIHSPTELGQRAASGKFEWDLGELDLRPGARVAYHLEAKDNDDVGGPNIGFSRTLYLTVTSPREQREAALAVEEQLLEAAIGQLADRLELQRGDDEKLVAAIAALHPRAEALLALLAQTETALAADKQSRPEVGTQLREMHARLGKLTRDEETLLAESKKPAPHAKPARALEAGNGRHVAELERDVIALDDLLGRQRMEELLRVGDEMSQARDRLKSLLEQYKRTRSEATKKEIERELRELERKLAELRQKASKLASAVPDQFLNREAMGKGDMQGQLDKLRDMLAHGDVDRALAELERLSSTLDKMIASMEGDLRGYRRERFTAEEKALAELESKLADLEHDERQIQGQTEEVRQRTRAEAQRRMRDKVEPFIKRAREQVAQVKKQLDAVEPPALSPFAQEELGRIRQRVADLDKALAEGDLDEARGMARLADQGMLGMAADLGEQEERRWRGVRPGARRAREHLEQGEAGTRELLSELDKVLPRPDELMSPEDAKRLGQLAEQQRAARRRASELERMGAPSPSESGKPALPRNLGEALRDAGQHMDRAEGRLRGRDARDASGEEGQALDKLAKLREQLQEERRPREQMSGGRIDREPVKIPGADEYHAPREFRQDLLEAMKKGAPADYKDQVKRYYEELVK
jgi:hypothetical protein